MSPTRCCTTGSGTEFAVAAKQPRDETTFARLWRTLKGEQLSLLTLLTMAWGMYHGEPGELWHSQWWRGQWVWEWLGVNALDNLATWGRPGSSYAVRELRGRTSIVVVVAVRIIASTSSDVLAGWLVGGVGLAVSGWRLPCPNLALACREPASSYAW